MFGDPGRGDRIARRIMVPLLVFLAVLIIVFYIVFTPRIVDGESMAPTLRDGDRVLSTKGYDTPSRGDVVVVRVRDRDGAPRAQGFIKRIIAIEGDTVRVDSGMAYVNGAPESGEYQPITSGGDLSVDEFVMPPGTVYVLGDNRPISYDSRIYGPAPLDAIAARVLLVWSPIGRMGRVD